MWDPVILLVRVYVAVIGMLIVMPEAIQFAAAMAVLIGTVLGLLMAMLLPEYSPPSIIRVVEVPVPNFWLNAYSPVN